MLRESDPDLTVWPRVVATLAAGVPTPTPRAGVRRLSRADTDLLAALPADIAWIHESWGGIDGPVRAGVVARVASRLC